MSEKTGEPTPRPVAIEIDGARLYAEWRREPDPARPALVFLHDGLGGIETWRGFPDLLADALGLGGFAYDRLGYGRSDALDPFPAHFIEDAAERLPRILDEAGIEECALVGHSDGATIALIHAARAPDRVRAVISLSAHVRQCPNSARGLEEYGDMARRGEVPDWMTRFQGPRGLQVMRDWTGRWRRNFDTGWDISSSLSGIAAPLFAAQGDDDDFTHPLQLEAIAAAAPHAETMLLEGVGHFPHMEDAPNIARLCADFLRRTGI